MRFEATIGRYGKEGDRLLRNIRDTETGAILKDHTWVSDRNIKNLQQRDVVYSGIISASDGDTIQFDADADVFYIRDAGSVGQGLSNINNIHNLSTDKRYSWSTEETYELFNKDDESWMDAETTKKTAKKPRTKANNKRSTATSVSVSKIKN